MYVAHTCIVCMSFATYMPVPFILVPLESCTCTMPILTCNHTILGAYLPVSTGLEVLSSQKGYCAGRNPTTVLRSSNDKHPKWLPTDICTEYQWWAHTHLAPEHTFLYVDTRYRYVNSHRWAVCAQSS